ncbi:hypothetical protein [Rhizobium bangladeshense]|uniref:hypothetical protein n=1 Tax=Rhizobium bangladeshense TaxID=1138189 RepID=UPI001A98FADC|nr:hypothetical protein [Rhizobium bangladeshense]MBX4931279.1 hypothetical protein [Rhizobium bangladeshense]MBY3582212.1 hypothetical protein [Rhizobium bangladeshense]QSY90367.1 hypothetical protein J2J98_09710 [Rhizobium bangladeshense]
MPRNGQGQYSKPPNTTAQPNTVIKSATFNAVVDDLVTDANNPRPITAGGTGANTVEGARSGLGLEKRTTYAVKSADYAVVAADNNAIHRFTTDAVATLDAAATMGISWHYTVIADGGDVTLNPNGSETIDGVAELIVPDGTSVFLVCDGTEFFTDRVLATLNEKADETDVGSFIDGGILSNNSGNPNTHIDIAPISVRSGALFVGSASTVTKRLNGTFAAGTGSGGLDTGAVGANGTYFLYGLRKNSDRSFDAVFSTSPTIAGVNTTLLTGYTIVKCIGVVLTDGSSIIRPFIMYPRDEYTFVTPVKDAVGVSISATSNLLALTVPNGVKSRAKLRFEFTSTATTNAALLSDPAQGVLAAGIGDDGGNLGTMQVASGFAIGSQEIWTNTSRQIRRVAGASGSLWIWTDGFHFPCGRNA